MQHKKNLKIGFKPYLELINKIIKQMKVSGFEPDHIICIVRGGTIIGLRMSYLLDKPLAVIAAEHWPSGEELPEVVFARHVVYKTDTINKKVLVVDDLTENGKTLDNSIPYLKSKFPDISEIKTAVVYHKTTSNFTPDFYGQLIKPDKEGNMPWITNPFENPEILLDGIEEEEINKKIPA